MNLFQVEYKPETYIFQLPLSHCVVSIDLEICVVDLIERPATYMFDRRID